jgi:hypothetical protein
MAYYVVWQYVPRTRGVLTAYCTAARRSVVRCTRLQCGRAAQRKAAHRTTASGGSVRGYVRERRYLAVLNGGTQRGTHGVLTGYPLGSVAPCRVAAALPSAVLAALTGPRRARQRSLAHTGVSLVWCRTSGYSRGTHGYSRNTRRRGVDVSHSVAQSIAPRGALVLCIQCSRGSTHTVRSYTAECRVHRSALAREPCGCCFLSDCAMH